MKKLIIIPAYNESENILSLIEKIEKECIGFDYVVVNDCSVDDTKSILKNNNASFLDLPINLGIGGGVQAGYKYALENNYDIAIQMDGDGQHPPEYINDIIEPIISDTADFVVGSRFVTKEGFQSSKLRRSGIVMISKWLRVLTGIKIKDVTSGYRAVNIKGIEMFAREYAQDFPEPEALALASLGNIRITEVPIIMKERQGGVSSISGSGSLYYMIKVLTSLALVRISNKKNRGRK